MPEADIWMSRARSALQEADTLLGAGFAAASVSRSYYAMFYAARALLSTKGTSPKSHGGTLQKLGELFVKTGLLPAEAAAELGATMEMGSRLTTRSSHQLLTRRRRTKRWMRLEGS